ncbi:MAG: biotin/lipoyl-binding protein [Lachnospiraceae bacterium]|nr:biotin/lipoyl-binding protein [Lachnospiraceae bacterium]
MDKKKLLKITAVFFACMLCFTVLSRAADQMSVAVVSTSRPENRMITHEVRASGKIVQNQELAVTTEPNQRVKTLYVSEGDRVKKGDLLFEVDMTVLEEQILNQQQEMEKQNLTVSDAKSQKDVNAQQKASQQAQAAEQYSLSTHSAGVRLSRAEKALSEAKKELKKFRKKHQKDTSVQDSSVEASLEKACEEKAQAYIQAQQELTEVQWKIENAVKTALQEAINAGTTASLVSNGAVLTGCALQEMPEIIVEEGSEGEESNASDGMEDAGGGYTGDIIIDESEVVGDGTADNGISGGDTQYESENIEDNGADGGTADNGTTGENGSIGGSGNTIIEGTDGSGEGNRTPTQEELDRIEQSVRSSYASELTAAQQKADNALLEKQEAEAALAQYQKERMDAESAQNKDSEKQLIANVKAAQQAYEDAAIAANEAAVTSGRAVQQAGIPDAQNSSDRMNEITYEQMELQLAKLEKLKEEGGRIKAPSDGLITKIQVITGEKTTDTTAMLMTDLSKGYRFTGEITKKQEEYIGTGDLVTLTGSSKKQVLEELPVESVTEDEENKSIRHITVQIPQESDVFALGAAATLSFSKKSEAYPICVPISALRLDEKNQTYVLVTEQYESVLGTETRARRVGVTVLEKNESYAALSEGGISSQQEVIISSAKAVDDGSRVRVQKQ